VSAFLDDPIKAIGGMSRLFGKTAIHREGGNPDANEMRAGDVEIRVDYGNPREAFVEFVEGIGLPAVYEDRECQG